MAFWNKVYDVINFVHDATNEVVSRDSDYFACVAM